MCLICSDTDASLGCRYSISDDGILRCVEVRQQLLSGEWASYGEESEVPPPKVIEWQTSPTLDITPTAFGVNRSATYAAVAGPSLSDPEVFSVHLLELVSAYRSGGTVTTVTVDPTFFSYRPGLSVLQLSWHPDSDGHVAILASDSSFRLYNIMDTEMPEQTFELRAHGKYHGLGLLGDEDPGDAIEKQMALNRQPVAFQFGRGDDWEKFAVYFLFQSGQISCLCPVAAFGCRYPSRLIASLYESMISDDQNHVTTIAWLQRAFVLDRGIDKVEVPEDGLSSAQVCVPHALDEHCPMLSPPLAVRTSEDAENVETRWKHPGHAESLIAWQYAGLLTTMVTASTKGLLTVHIMVENANPRWLAVAPQCILNGSEEKILAVKHRCCDTMIDKEAPVCQSMLLMDVVQLERWHAPSKIVTRDGSIGSLDYLSDEPDAMGATHGSHQITLELDPSAEELLYCITPRGMYGICIPYLPVLADFLGAAVCTGDSTVKKRDPALLPDVFPRPITEELSSNTTNGIVAATAIGDSLCGSGIVFVRDDSSGEFVRIPSHLISCDRLASAGSKVTGLTPEKDTSALRLDLGPTVDEQIQKIYGEILKGPKSLDSSVRSSIGPDVSQSPERTLADAIARLQTTHVEFAYLAHHDLMGRLSWLQGEVRRQDRRSSRLAELMEAALDRTKELQNRMERGLWMADNINKRIHILAELHWALPRPLSDAEQTFRQNELPAIEAIIQQLKQDVNSARFRSTALLEESKTGEPSRGDGTSATGTEVAPSRRSSSISIQQLGRLRGALTEHDVAIRSLAQKLQSLQLTLEDDPFYIDDT